MPASFQSLDINDSPRQADRSSLLGCVFVAMARLLELVYDLFAGLVSSIKGCFRPGTTSVNGRTYKTIRPLGEGGFSYVYLVQETAPRRSLFALKKVRLQLPEHEDRFQKEIEAHKSVDSPHVLKLVDYEIVRDSKGTEGLLLLPYHHLGTVQDLIDNTPPRDFIPMPKIIKFAIGIAKGLQAFHTHNPPLAYRDLKPANVLIGEEDLVVLTDLGSVAEARVRITNRRDATVLQEHCAETVTATYRAPELFDPPTGSLVDERSDVWALGCTLYAMAYKSPPFDGTLTAVVNSRVRFPLGSDPYGQPFRNLIESMLVTSPASRPTIDVILSKCEALQSALGLASDSDV
ncbi:kinase-like domain-containing protein [Polychytrium aggregatum]|uniref:kinase-like domain-containing protein n=1 Tax=Polychytrium aggregatum TaxID=110093 RepID=UPI0022FDFBCF|nr:kinase-like domain-containing protein [Polychytrium aggregatum]KAI9199677.1 kinase-like domain-containing protein [Polychytrium aggregatum]